MMMTDAARSVPTSPAFLAGGGTLAGHRDTGGLGLCRTRRLDPALRRLTKPFRRDELSGGGELRGNLCGRGGLTP